MSLRIYPLTKLVSMRIAKLFWNLSFKVEELQLKKLQTDYAYNWEILLTTYRDEAISQVTIFVKNHTYHEYVKTAITDSIFLLHLAYHQLLLWKIIHDPDNKIDLLEEGKHYAPNYFSADGKFNDILWTKHLLHNPRYPLAYRFKLASAYYFAEDFKKLWAELVTLDDVPFEDGFEFFGFFRNKFKQFKGLVQEYGWHLNCNDTFFFHEIASKGYEHAVNYVWCHMLESKKFILMENNKFFVLIARGLINSRFNVSYYLYSQLTEERKKDFIQWSIRSCSVYIWLPLLLTPYMEECRTEILEIVCQLPLQVLSRIIECLSCRIKQLKLTSDVQLFQVLWKKISVDEKNCSVILRKDRHVIENLVKAQSFYIVGCIIKMLPRDRKRRCLFNGLFGAGTHIFDILCQSRKLHLLENYLYFFLFDIDSTTKEPTLYRKAVLFFQNFKKSSGFKVWCKKYPIEIENEVRRQICGLQASVAVLREICGNKSVKEKDTRYMSRITTFEEYFVESE